jgi:hypothetical protein
MNKVLCQINSKGFTQKPQTLQEYGKLREKIIQTGWQALTEGEFIHKVTEKGYAFYGCLFNGHDLMETGREKECWRMQTLIGLDFDHCTVSPEEMCAIYAEQGFDPWLSYETFSSRQNLGEFSYRILWRVEPNLNSSYDRVHSLIKRMGGMTPYADKNAMTVTRLWQGSRSGPVHYDSTAPFLKV